MRIIVDQASSLCSRDTTKELNASYDAQLQQLPFLGVDGSIVARIGSSTYAARRLDCAVGDETET